MKPRVYCIGRDLVACNKAQPEDLDENDHGNRSVQREYGNLIILICLRDEVLCCVTEEFGVEAVNVSVSIVE